jgi:hypothetical protein
MIELENARILKTAIDAGMDAEVFPKSPNPAASPFAQ